jgi:hypothetical protein
MMASIVCLVFFSASEAAKRKNDLEREGLKGPVKKVLIEIAKLSKSTGTLKEHSRIPWLSMTFDRSGNKIEEDQLYVEEVLNFKSVFAYDPQGRLKEGTEFNYKGGADFKWEYSYDPTGKRIEETRYDLNTKSFFSRSSYLYDDAGNLIEETRLHALSANDFKWIYRYDDKRNKIEEDFFVTKFHKPSNGKKSTLDTRTVWHYDGKGNAVDETRYDPSGSMKSKKFYSYEYDARGNWIEQFARTATSSGRPEADPSEVTYRTITYY